MNGIYIVGNARSGTTMMGRILNNHSLIHTFTEIHFFEQLWSGKESNKVLSVYDGMQLCALLLNIAREGYFSKRHVNDFISDAEKIIYNEQLTSLEIYRRVLQSETVADGKNIFCKQTPQNVFYIREIKEALPGSKFIFMVRDPRSVLLSQKNKWRRRFLGGSHVNRYEMVRSWFNYHPITISQLWNSSFNSGMKFVKDENLLQVRFEDLLSEPEKTIQSICGFLNISFEAQML
ncbi:MAG: sulfotransferase, partial [Bacteroidota bacterium]